MHSTVKGVSVKLGANFCSTAAEYRLAQLFKIVNWESGVFFKYSSLLLMGTHHGLRLFSNQESKEKNNVKC